MHSNCSRWSAKPKWSKKTCCLSAHPGNVMWSTTERNDKDVWKEEVNSALTSLNNQYPHLDVYKKRVNKWRGSFVIGFDFYLQSKSDIIVSVSVSPTLSIWHWWQQTWQKASTSMSQADAFLHWCRPSCVSETARQQVWKPQQDLNSKTLHI